MPELEDGSTWPASICRQLLSLRIGNIWKHKEIQCIKCMSMVSSTAASKPTWLLSDELLLSSTAESHSCSIRTAQSRSTTSPRPLQSINSTVLLMLTLLKLRSPAASGRKSFGRFSSRSPYVSINFMELFNSTWLLLCDSAIIQPKWLSPSVWLHPLPLDTFDRCAALSDSRRLCSDTNCVSVPSSELLLLLVDSSLRVSRELLCDDECICNDTWDIDVPLSCVRIAVFRTM